MFEYNFVNVQWYENQLYYSSQGLLVFYWHKEVLKRSDSEGTVYGEKNLIVISGLNSFSRYGAIQRL